jgi:hypothetical protein
MKLMEQFHSLWRVPVLTRRRMVWALAVALVADGLQLLLNGVGWFGPDEVIDCVAMVLVSRVIGFHPLFLPTFVVEFIPLLDDLPTWTACTIAVIALRKREQNQGPPPQPPPDKPVIEV